MKNTTQLLRERKLLTERMLENGYTGSILRWIPDPYLDDVFLALVHPSGIPEDDHSHDYSLLFTPDGEMEEFSAEDFHRNAQRTR